MTSNYALAKNAFELVSSATRRRIVLYFAIETLVSILEIIGILSVGLVVSGLISKYSNLGVPTAKNRILDLLHVDLSSTKGIALAFGGILLVLMTKSIVALLARRIMLLALATESSVIASSYIEKFYKLNFNLYERITPLSLEIAMTDGIQMFILVFLGYFAMLVAELASAGLLLTGLFIYSPLGTTVLVAFFGGVFVLLSRVLGARMRTVNRRSYEYSLKAKQNLLDIYNIKPEVQVFNTGHSAKEHFRKSSENYSREQAQELWFQQFPKYLIEIIFISSIGLLGVLGTTMDHRVATMGVLVIFSVAGFRMMPSLLRIQQFMHEFSRVRPRVLSTLEFLNQANLQNNLEIPSVPSVRGDLDSTVLNVSNLSLSRDGSSDSMVIRDLTFSASIGDFVAIMGPSGVGKSTLLLAIAGLIRPQQGEVTGFRGSTDFLSPSKMAYVPQSVELISGTLRENFLLGRVDDSSVSDEKLLTVVEELGLTEFVNGLSLGLDTVIEPQNLPMSGGQKQRIGLARALLSGAKLILIDEATSALDSESQELIIQCLKVHQKESCILFVTHSESVKLASSKVINLEKNLS